MRLTIATVAATLGFAKGFVAPRAQSTPAFATQKTPLSAIDPSQFFHDVHHHYDPLQSVFSTLLLDVDPGAAAPPTPEAVSPEVAAEAMKQISGSPAAMDPDAAAAAAAAGQGNGWFGFLAGPIEGLLSLLHSGLVMVGVPNAWGIAIIAMTVVIKIVTFPLTKTQLESTNKMQALQPTIKEIQNTYQSNPEVMNQKIADVYQKNQVNPLAGCLPSLVQIPVFVGLYRSVLNLAKEDQLNEPFLFLPNLEGPTYGADPSHASEWITTWVDGTPALGWHDTIAFLAIPVFLIISQYASMALMQTPQTKDAQNNLVFKVLPLMIGWFSVNVPAALGIYWVANNIITTATTVAIRNSMKMPEPATATTGTTTTTATPGDIFSNPKVSGDSPQGFSSSVFESEDIKPITQPIDAEIVDDDDGEDDGAMEVDDTAGTGMQSSSTPKKKSRKKKKKKRKY